MSRRLGVKVVPPDKQPLPDWEDVPELVERAIQWFLDHPPDTTVTSRTWEYDEEPSA